MIVDPANIETAGKFDDSELDVLLYELKADLNAYLAALGANGAGRTLAGHHRLQRAPHAIREMPGFGQGPVWCRPRRRARSRSKEYRDALAHEFRCRAPQGIDATMKKYKLDAIVAPTGSPPWVTDLVNGDHFSGAQLDAGRGRRLSEHQRARGILAQSSGGHLVLRSRVQRADADQARVRVRAGDQASPRSAVSPVASDAG